MKLSKRQLEMCNAMLDGGWIWLSAGKYPYLATVKNGNIASKAIHIKTFQAMVEGGVLVCGEDGKYRVKQ